MDQYTVLKVIGEGSFGRALLVQHENNNHKFVMKEICLPKSSSGIHNSRQEAILLSRMKHPYIVAFKESFEADGHLYIVMEYCDGGDLLQAIKQQRGNLFPENKILHWFVQLCMAVKHIHDKRVLHRDIKSKNIFLTQYGLVKLGDFGSARLLVSPKAYACTYVGTPYYVPPEIWENLPYNNKSDIWSLGCVLYELCTLKHPFQANSWKSLIRKICQGAYCPLPAQYSYELHYLIKQMFKRCPKSRPSASTILERGSLAKHIETRLPVEILAEVGRHCRKKGDNDVEKPQRKIDGDLEAGKCDKMAAVNRKKWTSGPSNTVLNCLENAPILTSSTAAAGEDGSGGVIKFNENRSRKQWVKESPDTLLNMLQNADLSLAFKTYTIYKPPALGEPLAGPLSDKMKVPDTTDGIEEEIAVDPNRFESRSDEEDTDFEEEEEDQDWVSALKSMVEEQ